MASDDQKQVMIIDDDTITLEMLAHLVREFDGVKPYLFSSSIEASGFLHSAQAKNLDLVLCDWQMPGLNGLDFLKQFRVTSPATPFVLITASPTKELVRETKVAGVTDLIVKPLNGPRLSAKLASYLKH